MSSAAGLLPAMDSDARWQADAQSVALRQLLVVLRERNYHFITPTPASQARVVARPERRVARSLVDVFGWNRPFPAELVDSEVFALLRQAGALQPHGDGLLRSRYRVSSLSEDLYLHSAYPTDGRDAVFFGPDSYRFAALIANELARHPPRADADIVDIGTGAGVGAIVAAKLTRGASLVGTDVNPEALRLAAINATAAGIALQTALAADLSFLDRAVDLVLANPPYLMDGGRRAYRDGGAMLGGEVSLRMAESAVARLAPGGRLILYTGSAIVNGEDALRPALADLAARARCELRYGELDPDVFGEELERPAYRHVERISLIGAVISKPARVAPPIARSCKS